ncbi:MAG: dihydrodipicolinate synthase [Streptomycetaceae bacterium]|nr:dihydrodipicolinate synthase [Streptomycetaceae bacterium]
MATRVIQWATGPVGRAALRETIENPDLELVGVLVHNTDKVGTDAGALVGLPPTGVTATDSKAAILSLDADVVVHAASKAVGTDASVDDIEALLASGKSVISTTSYVHVPTVGDDVYRRFQHACAKGGSRFLAAGEHPGYMFERLAVGLTLMSQRVDKITVREFVDCSQMPQVEMLVDLMGMGRQPEEITTTSRVFRSMSVEFEQSLAAAADALSLRIDDIRTDIETATVRHDVVLAHTTLPAGSVVGQILRWTAFRGGEPLLVAEEYWACTDDIPGWDLPLDGHTVRVLIEGAPTINLELGIDISPIPQLGGVSGGVVAVAMTAVRAIPYVMKAKPGIVVPEIFGAYRWPS